MKKSTIVDVISALLIFLFMYASVSKFVIYSEFIGQMNSQPFPNWMTPYLVWGVPGIEILIALALIFPKTKLNGLWASFILMSIFTLYIILILTNVFNKIPCSCGGVLRSLGWKQHLIFNLFFLIISGIGILLEQRRENDNNLTNSKAAFT